MKLKRTACVPLLVQDPYTSVWSGSDTANSGDTIHWSGRKQRIYVDVRLGEKEYRLVGESGDLTPMEQTSVNVTALRTIFTYENDKAAVELAFMTPLDVTDLTVMSRPCSYIDARIRMKNEKPVRAFLKVTLTSDLVSSDQTADLIFPVGTTKNGRFVSMGRQQQHPLGGSGDNVTLDWGYAYLAVTDSASLLSHSRERGTIAADVPFANGEAHVLFAYDDLVSINYFGQFRRAYWTKTYASITAAIDAALMEREEQYRKAAQFDDMIEKKALEAGGDDYVFLCDMAYRQTVAAHKLITDEEGNLLFLSKENDSNGCIGTVDVSYPSVPLFLWLNPELVKGMLRPVFRFADMDAWTYDFAPHDVGRYPYAWGQVYGLNKKPRGAEDFWSGRDGDVYPPFYVFGKEDDLFDLRYQMPVEECGNMIIMTLAVCLAEKKADFAEPYMGTLAKWKEYLLEYGEDPAEQLCTDDFAGHLSHNVNLSVKAVMGIEAYSRLCSMTGRSEEAESAHESAVKMAESWEKRAAAGDHTMLAFGRPDTWSLKYNMVWDKLIGSGLFDEEIIRRDIAFDLGKANKYGVPLDSRADYTKSDWILWVAAMTDDKEVRKELISGVARYLRETPTRYPFGDWYDTKSGQYCHFKGRSVQGGIFMPILADEWKNKRQ
ncbi:MAG: glutaminase domain-containing protein [Lachnospiraceae bacterium]|jgi:hypothetical protein